MTEVIIQTTDKILTNGIINKINKVLEIYKFSEFLPEMDINIDDLHNDNWREIISYLDLDDIYSIRKVNKSIHLSIKECIKTGFKYNKHTIYLDKVIHDNKKIWIKRPYYYPNILLMAAIDNSYKKLVYTYEEFRDYRKKKENLANKIYLLSDCGDIEYVNDNKYPDMIFMINNDFNKEIDYECRCDHDHCCIPLTNKYKNIIYPYNFDPEEILGFIKKSKELLYYESIMNNMTYITDHFIFIGYYNNTNHGNLASLCNDDHKQYVITQ